MKEIVVIGAGRIGATIADMLSQSGDYRVTVMDRSAQALAGLEAGPEIGTVLDMLASGQLPQRGFVAQEEIALERFLANRFGAAYAQEPSAIKVA